MSQEINLCLEGTPPQIVLSTVDCTPLFVSRLRAELNIPGIGTKFRLSVNEFLSSRRIVQALCRQFSVNLTADTAATNLLNGVNLESRQLDRVLAEAPALSSEETLARIQGTRFIRNLRTFQIRDLGRLLGIPHGANFSVPGAGKTTVAYATFEAERAVNRVNRLLVVAPLSAFDAWISEPIDCFDIPPVVYPFEAGRPIPSNAEVVITNYSKLPNTDNFAALSAWLQAGPAHIILDEAHRIKRGRDGVWGTACLDLSWYAVRRDVLSGTPAPQHPSDLEAPMEFLWPGQARKILPAATFSAIPLPTIGHELAQALAPLQVRTRKAELDLDIPQMRVYEFELVGLQREIYLAITNQYSGAIPASTRDRARLAEMRHIVMYLLEAATNPALLSLGSSPDDPLTFQHPRSPIPADSNLVSLLNRYGMFETPPKFRKLAELIRANAESGRKTLVWSNFVRNLGLLRQHLGLYRPAMIHGGVPSVVSQPLATLTREMELKRFREDDDCMVLLANPAAMSEGVSLHHTCHDAIYLERTFNAGQYLQSVDRIHRLGLAPGTETRITFMVTKNTIDQIVHRRVFDKAARLGEILDDPDIVTMALPDESDLQDVDSGFGQPLDDDMDVAALFAHLRGEHDT